MPNPYFSFKQFTVYHDRCAMKVGTDGVLLGAWTDVSGACDILDVGTGTGLIALMLAQRSEAHIVAVDIDEDAVKQAKENVEKSPWPGRIEVERHDICCFNSDIRYDVIVSNPPYSIPWDGDNDATLINDPRFAPAGVLAPRSKADFAFTMHMLSWLSAQGTAAIVEFPGILYRSGAEQKIRRYLCLLYTSPSPRD